MLTTRIVLSRMIPRRLKRAVKRNSVRILNAPLRLKFPLVMGLRYRTYEVTSKVLLCSRRPVGATATVKVSNLLKGHVCLPASSCSSEVALRWERAALQTLSFICKRIPRYSTRSVTGTSQKEPVALLTINNNNTHDTFLREKDSLENIR